MLTRLHSIVGIATISAIISSVDADVLTYYNFGTGTTGSYAPSSVNPNVSASDMSSNGATGLSISFRTNAVQAPATAPCLQVYYSSQATYNNGTSAAAVSKPSYLSFTVTAAPGYVLDLDTLTFGAWWGKGGSTSGFVLQNSAIGFSSDQTTNVPYTGTTFSSGTSTNSGLLDHDWMHHAAVVVDLSGTAYHDLSSIEFRIFPFTGGVGLNNYELDFDDFALNGQVVATPEPAALSLLALGGAAIFLRRRATKN